MAGEFQKLKDTTSRAPLGAIGGAIIGYLTAKRLGYEKNISVISFTMVGIIIGSALGAGVKEKINNK